MANQMSATATYARPQSAPDTPGFCSRWSSFLSRTNGRVNVGVAWMPGAGMAGSFGM